MVPVSYMQHAAYKRQPRVYTLTIAVLHTALQRMVLAREQPQSKAAGAVQLCSSCCTGVGRPV